MCKNITPETWREEVTRDTSATVVVQYWKYWNRWLQTAFFPVMLRTIWWCFHKFL